MASKYGIFLTIVIVQNCYHHFKTYEDSIETMFSRKYDSENVVNVSFSEAWNTGVVNCHEELQNQIENYSTYSLQHTVDFKKEFKTKDYYECEPTTTSLPTLLLLLRTDENGIPYAPKVIPPIDPNNSYGYFEKDFIDICMTEDKQVKFDEPMRCMFYQYGLAKMKSNTRMQGIGFELLEDDEEDIEEMPYVEGNTCLIDNLTAVPVTELEFKKLALLTNANPFHVNTKQHGDKEYGLHDFKTILQKNYPTDAFQNWQSFVIFVKEFLNWQFWELDESQGLPSAIHRLRLFFNMVCKIGILPFDGNKRLLFAHKLFYGQNPGDSVIPLQFRNPTTIVPQRCNLMLPMYVNIVLPKYNLPVENCYIPKQEFQKYMPDEKSWKYWFDKTMHKITKLGNAITLEDFIKLPITKKKLKMKYCMTNSKTSPFTYKKLLDVPYFLVYLLKIFNQQTKKKSKKLSITNQLMNIYFSKSILIIRIMLDTKFSISKQ